MISDLSALRFYGSLTFLSHERPFYYVSVSGFLFTQDNRTENRTAFKEKEKKRHHQACCPYAQYSLILAYLENEEI